MVRVFLAFYAGLAALALGINWVRGVPLAPLAGVPGRLGPALGAALAVGLATVALSALSERRYTWARELKAVFRGALGTLGRGEVLALAVSSSIAEELFFRATLQQAFHDFTGSVWVGLALATTAFAVLHIAPQRPGRLWAWTLFAFVLGLCLGGLYAWSGSILPPIALHVVVNALNLRRITRPLPATEASIWPHGA